MPFPPPRLQTSVKFPNIVAYFLYFARCDYQTRSNYELLGALSSSIHRLSLLHQNPMLEKKRAKVHCFRSRRSSDIFFKLIHHTAANQSVLCATNDRLDCTEIVVSKQRNSLISIRPCAKSCMKEPPSLSICE